MKDIFNKKGILLIGVVLTIIISALIFVISRIGNAYQQGLSNLTDQPAPVNSTHITRDTIIKITVQTSGSDDGCIEVTPDGVVRKFETCGEKLTTAHRVNDASNINRLFKLATEAVFDTKAQTAEAVASCTGYVMRVETSTSQFSVCIGNSTGQNGGSGSGSGSGGNGGGGSGSGGGSGGGGGLGDIIDTIKKIIEDIPPTPTPQVPTGIPTSTPLISGTPAPTVPVTPGQEPTPTPTVIVLRPFTCGYSEAGDGKKKPYNVSNYICSDLPQPGQ